MATYSNKHPMMGEANTGASVPHFAWFYPGSYFPTPKTSLNPSQGTQGNPEPGLPVAPIRSIAPTSESASNEASGTKSAKGKKQKASEKGSNQAAPTILRPNQPKKKPAGSKRAKGPLMPEAKREKKNPNINMDGVNFDFSGVPSPVCSCTGVARVCYKWGAGGWQSSCCTISISEYPLPMSTTRPGARMAGRKMSNGAYLKLLLKLAAEGHDLSHPVDLRNHWARHGTNKFVTIK